MYRTLRGEGTRAVRGAAVPQAKLPAKALGPWLKIQKP